MKANASIFKLLQGIGGGVKTKDGCQRKPFQENPLKGSFLRELKASLASFKVPFNSSTFKKDGERKEKLSDGDSSYPHILAFEGWVNPLKVSSPTDGKNLKEAEKALKALKKEKPFDEPSSKLDLKGSSLSSALPLEGEGKGSEARKAFTLMKDVDEPSSKLDLKGSSLSSALSLEGEGKGSEARKAFTLMKDVDEPSSKVDLKRSSLSSALPLEGEGKGSEARKAFTLMKDVDEPSSKLDLKGSSLSSALPLEGEGRGFDDEKAFTLMKDVGEPSLKVELKNLVSKSLNLIENAPFVEKGKGAKEGAFKVGEGEGAKDKVDLKDLSELSGEGGKGVTSHKEAFDKEGIKFAPLLKEFGDLIGEREGPSTKREEVYLEEKEGSLSFRELSPLSFPGSKGESDLLKDLKEGGVGVEGRPAQAKALFDSGADLERTFTDFLKKFELHVKEGRREALVELNPPELGKVKFSLEVQEDKVNVRFWLPSQEVKTLFESNLQQLQALFRGYGYHFEASFFYGGSGKEGQGYERGFSGSKGMPLESGKTEEGSMALLNESVATEGILDILA